MSTPVRLDAGSVDAIARRVVELLAEEHVPAVALVDAATVARALGVSRATVYEHADILGARSLTDPSGGRKPRLRFDLDEAVAAWQARPPVKPAAQPLPARVPRRRASSSPAGSRLLPIRGQEAA